MGEAGTTREVEDNIARIFHQARQAELAVGSGEWLLEVIGAIAVETQRRAPDAMPLAARSAALEAQLRASGLEYGTAAPDEAIALDPAAGPGTRAFAHFIAAVLRLCARAATLSHAPWFMPRTEAKGIDARRGQLLAILAAVSGESEAAARLFDNPLAAPSPLPKLAGKAAAHFARRFLAVSGPFAGLPLHNGLCAVEARTCATVALVSFGHGRMSPAAVAIAGRAALGWRALLVELLAGLAQGQRTGAASLRGMEQVLRSQRLPVREARLLRAALHRPRQPEQLVPQLRTDALRRFALTQVLLAALVDDRFEPGEAAFVERLAQSTGISAPELAQLETEVANFYRVQKDALAALRLAEAPEGLPHALTTRLEETIADNLARILQEIRETKELAELLAKASVGNTLSSEEKSKVREQLLDLAKTIPALAIFAAPGGMLLLPILIKLLPFNLLPSSFVDPKPHPPKPLPALPEAHRRSGS
jgi:hypothetical protein